MDRLQELLTALNPIVKESRREQALRDKNGENFNVFKVLKLERNEERLHSAFIAELLNPQGAHGMKDTFLKLFMNIFIDWDKDCEKWEFDTKNAIVDTEHTFENGRIDILIENPHERKGIIIENKIDACDQEEQLLRYDRFGKSRYQNTKNYQLIYLTLKGDEASEKSIKNNKVLYNRYIRASYKEDIIRWVELCINNHPFLPIQTMLQQYLTNLKNIFGMIMDEKNLKKLLQKTTCRKNVETSIAIIKHQDYIQKAIIENFINQMQTIAEKHSLVCTTYGDLPNLQPNSGLIFYYRNKHWCLFIGSTGKYIKRLSVIYAITQRNDDGIKIPMSKEIKELSPAWEKTRNQNTQSAKYPLGFVNLSWAHAKSKQNKWYDWKDWQTTEAMANGSLAKWIEKIVFNEVINKKNLLHKNLLTYMETKFPTK